MNISTTVVQKFMSAPITKSEFARRVGVGRSCVANWIVAGKITAPALVMVGRSEKIDEDVARSQLGDRLDVDQRLANGRALLSGDASPVDADPVVGRIKAARLRQIELANSKAEAEAAERAGRYVLADAMRQEVGRIAGAMISAVEGGLVDLANAVAVDTGANQRDVLVALRRAWRVLRMRLSASEAEAAIHEPEIVEARP